MWYLFIKAFYLTMVMMTLQIDGHGMMILALQVPPKSEPKQIIKEEPFQLDSLARYGEEIRREIEERQCGKTRG